DLSKPETFEPPCCARAQVALIIVAIDDHRLVAIKRSRRPAVQVSQRDADRAWQPLLLVLNGGQRFDELRADGRHRQHFFSIDLCRHRLFLLDIVGSGQWIVGRGGNLSLFYTLRPTHHPLYPAPPPPPTTRRVFVPPS